MRWLLVRIECKGFCLMFAFITIADIYISTSMETFEHRKYKIRGENGNN